MEKNTLVAIGEALIDMMPDKRACDFDEVTAFMPKVGGAPANVCGAFVRLGGRGRLLTQLGDDPFGHKILHELSGYGIETDCVRLTDTANTALAFVSSGVNGERTFSFYRKPSADMLYASADVRPAYFDDAFALHFCSVSLGDFPMKEAHRAAIGYAREAGCIVSFDPNLRFPLWPDHEALRRTVLEFLPMADVVKISDEELEFITGKTRIGDALAQLFVGHVQLVLYTRGKDGAVAFTKAARAEADGLPAPVLDTTGAGDGFAGSFLWKLYAHGVGQDDLPALDAQTLADCVQFANAFCTMSVQKLGAIASYPTAEEMQIQ